MLLPGDHAAVVHQAVFATSKSWLPTRTKPFRMRLGSYPRPVLVSTVQDNLHSFIYLPGPYSDHLECAVSQYQLLMPCYTKNDVVVCGSQLSQRTRNAAGTRPAWVSNEASDLFEIKS